MGQNTRNNDRRRKSNRIMCLYPTIIKNPKYKPNKKNGGYPPFAWDRRIMYMPIGCGMCVECCKKASREWQIRLSEELKNQKNAIFVTLTFDEEKLQHYLNKAEKEERKTEIGRNDKRNLAAKIAIRDFLERWRKEHGKSVKHWLITELGHKGTERIHLHGIIFTDKKYDIERKWQNGFVYLGDYVSQRTINYIIKYIYKQDEENKDFRPKIMASPGIGENYEKTINGKLNKYIRGKTDETYRFKDGNKAMLPIYYRNKIYTEKQREKLWIEKIDKNIRWVSGEKIDVSTEEGMKQFYELQKYYQNKNKSLGFQEPKDWNREKYKREIKILSLKKNENIKDENKEEKIEEENIIKCSMDIMRKAQRED